MSGSDPLLPATAPPADRDHAPPPTKAGRFRRLGKFVWREWDAVLGVASLVVLAITATAGDSDSKGWTASFVIALAALVASISRTRYRLDGLITRQKVQNKQIEDVVDVANRVLTGMPANEFVVEDRIKPDFLKAGSDLRISGVTLGRTLEDCQGIILATLNQHGYVRIMMTGVSDHTSIEFPFRFRTGELGDRATWQEKLAEFKEDLEKRLADSATELDKTLEKAEQRGLSGTLEVGMLPIVLPIGLVIISGDHGAATLRCELYHRLSTTRQAVFYLEEPEADWDDKLREMFDEYWNICANKQVLFSVGKRKKKFDVTVEALSDVVRQLAVQEVAEAAEDADPDEDPEPEPVAP